LISLNSSTNGDVREARKKERRCERKATEGRKKR
jgi:hypothetical protein